jgi:hypothetical protein
MQKFLDTISKYNGSIKLIAIFLGALVAAATAYTEFIEKNNSKEVNTNE